MSVQSIILGSLKERHFSSVLAYLFYLRGIVEVHIPNYPYK